MNNLFNLRHMKIIYLSLLTMFFFGCISQPKTELDSLTIPILDISKEYPEVKVDIHELGKVEYIPLETTDESVMATGWHNCISDKYIIMKDLSRVHLFNREGKHLFSFEHSGQGPKEYHYISELYTDFENKEIYIADPKKIQVYSFSGEWIRTVGNIPEGIRPEFTFNYNEKYLITHNVFHDYWNFEKLPVDLTPYYLIDKQTGEFIPLPLTVKNRISRIVHKEIKDISENVAQPIVEKILINPMLANGSDILIADFGLDTLYSYKNDRLTPIAVQYPSAHSTNPPVVIAPFFYTDQFLIFKPVEIRYDSKYALQPLDDAPLMMWNRKTNEIYRIQLYDSSRPNRKLKNTMEGMQLQNPNQIFIAHYADKLCTDNEEGKLKGELKEVASRLTEEDCHVVAICKLKDK
jgi:hypothetical protein